jgi:ComF family protein
VNLKTIPKRYFINLLDIIYPKNCAFCGGGLKKRSNFCTVCHRLINELSPKTLKSNIFQEQLALFKMNNEIKSVIHDLKYRGIYSPSEEIISLEKSNIRNIMKSIDIITPVPLHWFRKLKRGYNQAEILSTTLSKKYNKPSINLTKRVKYTSSQTKKNRENRAINISGAFKFRDNYNIDGKKILLIDDVYTTGATTEEIAKTVIKHGAKGVSLITLAYV